MSQLALKVDVFGADGSYSYEGDWTIGIKDIDLDFHKNLTSATKSVKIEKALNSSSLTASLSVAPVRDKEGNTWADRLNLMDCIIITVRKSTLGEGVREDIVFFGFIVNISDVTNISDTVVQNITISCDSIGVFLQTPFLRFDKLTEPFAALLSVNESIWLSLQTHVINGRPNEVIEGLIEIFRDYLKPMKLNHSGSKRDMGSYLSYDLRTLGYLLPMTYSTKATMGAFTNNFWSAIAAVAEVNNGVGWLNEMSLDIVSNTRLDKYLEITDKVFGDRTTVDLANSIPSDTEEDFHLILTMRPSAFPYWAVKDTEINKVVGNTEKLKDVEDKLTFDRVFWDSLVNSSIHHHTIDRYISLNSNKTLSNLKTVFFLKWEMDDSGNLDYMLPALIDIDNYERLGYNPLEIKTKYVHAKTSVQDNDAIDRTISVQSLAQLNLRQACYNTLFDEYRQGICVVQYSPEITIGDLCTLDVFKQYEPYRFHVNKITHNIVVGGNSSTTIQFDRMLKVSDWKKIDKLLLNRLAITQTLSMKALAKKKLLQPQVADFIGALGD